MKKILIFDRPFTRAFTREYASLARAERFVRISDFKYRDEVGLVSRQYRYLRGVTGAERIPVDIPTVIRNLSD